MNLENGKSVVAKKNMQRKTWRRPRYTHLDAGSAELGHPGVSAADFSTSS